MNALMFSDLDSSKSTKLNISPISTMFTNSNYQFPPETKESSLKNQLTITASNTSFKLPSLSSLTVSDQTQEQATFEAKCIRYSNFAISLLRFDEFIEGETSKTQLYFEKLYLEDKEVFRSTFQKTWLMLFPGNPKVFSTFINIASCLEYEWLNDRAEPLVIAGHAHRDIYVNEAIIRAVESWQQASHVEYLKMIRNFEISWLDEYKKDVMEQLERLQ